MKKTRKALAMLIVLCMVVCFAPLHANAYAPEDMESSFGSGFRFLFDLASQTLLVSGSGEMPAFDSADSVPWQNVKSQIKTLVLGDGITSISANAFADCTGLRRLVLPASVKSIAAGAFANCGNLKSIQTTGDVEALKEMLKDAGLDVSRINFTRISQAQFELLAANVRHTDAPGTRKAEDLSYVIIRYDFAKRPIYIEEMDSNGNKTTTEIEYLAQPAAGKAETVESRVVVEELADGNASFTATLYNDVGALQQIVEGDRGDTGLAVNEKEFRYGQYGATQIGTVDSVTVADDGSYTVVWIIRGDDDNNYNAFNEYREGQLQNNGGVNGVRETFGITDDLTKQIETYGADNNISSIKSTTTSNGLVRRVYSADFTYDDNGNQTMVEGREKRYSDDKNGNNFEILENTWTTTYEYDEETGNMTSSSCSQINNGWEWNSVTEYTYEDDTQLLKSAVTTYAEDPDWVVTEEYTYNENGSLQTYSYANPNRTQDVEYNYDEQGLKTGKTDTVTEGVYTTTTVTTYNEDERAVSRTETQTRGEQVNTVETSYRYGDGNVVESSVSTFTDALGGTTVTTTAYNEMGFVESQEFVTNRNDRETTRTESYTYDENGVLLARTSDMSNNDITNTNAFTYGADGQLTSRESSTQFGQAEPRVSSSTYEYNADGLLVKETEKSPNEEYEITYNYNDEGRIASAERDTFENGQVVESVNVEFDYQENGGTATISMDGQVVAEEELDEDGFLVLNVQ